MVYHALIRSTTEQIHKAGKFKATIYFFDLLKFLKYLKLNSSYFKRIRIRNEVNSWSDSIECRWASGWAPAWGRGASLAATAGRPTGCRSWTSEGSCSCASAARPNNRPHLSRCEKENIDFRPKLQHLEDFGMSILGRIRIWVVNRGSDSVFYWWPAPAPDSA